MVEIKTMIVPKFNFPGDPPPKQLAINVEVLIEDLNAKSILDALKEIKKKLPKSTSDKDISFDAAYYESGDGYCFRHTTYFPNPNFDSQMKEYQKKLEVAQKEYESFLLEYKKS